MQSGKHLRLYTELAAWWPLFSPPEHYTQEAAELWPVLLTLPDAPPATMLELGSGGGSMASHFKSRLSLTLSDRSEQMLAISQSVNPECEHVHGDMRSLDLGRLFDLVFIHDAIMYLTDEPSVRAALATAYRHCRPGGGLLVAPDWVSETFRAETECGGEDAPDGRGLRYLEWTWDPDPADQTYEAAFAFLLRDADGSLHVDRDRHRFGLFPRAIWLDWMTAAGFTAASQLDSSGRDIFTGTRPRRR